MSLFTASHNISGKVLDEEGNPTPATVVAVGEDERVAEVHRVEAGADGAFSMDLPEWSWWLHAECSDRMSRPERAVSDERRVEDDLELRLAPTGLVWGFVYDPDGRPLAAARVHTRTRPEWTGPSRQGNRCPQPAPSCHTEADSSGRYEIRACEGEVVIQAESDGLAAACVGGEVLAGLSVQVDVRLSRGLVPQGLVSDTSGRPIAGAVVSVCYEGRADWPPYPDRYEVVTDSDGRYRSLVPWGEWFSVSAWKAGFVSAKGEPDEQEPSRADLTLVRAGSIEGRVRMPGGATPTRDTRLGLRLASSPKNRFSPSQGYQYGRKPRLDADGVFCLEAIGPGRYVAQARVDGVAFGESVEIDLAEGEGVRGILVDLHPTCTVRGRIRMARSGEPMQRAGVGVVYRDGGGSGESARAISDEQGRFELRDVPPGSNRIRAWHKDCAPSEIDVELLEGQVLDRDIELGAGTRTHGRVALDGAVPKVWVQLMVQTPNLDNSRFPTMAADGSYEARGMEPGPWFVCVDFYAQDSGGHYRLARLIEVGHEEDVEVNFDLRSTPRTRGTVRQVGGPSGSGAVAFVGQGPLDGWTWIALLGESGEFDAGGLPPGDYVAIDGYKYKAVLDPATGRHRIPCSPGDPVIHLTGGDVDSLVIDLPAGR